MNRIKFTIASLTILVLLYSCDSYLDIKPKGRVILSTLEEYNLLLNSRFLNYTGDRALAMFTDDVDLQDANLQEGTEIERMYLWSAQISNETNSSPKLWTIYYRNIYYFNTVLEGIETAEGNDDKLRKQIRAEALVGRAFEYFHLLNLYGKSYNEATAKEDKSVPFVTSINIMADLPDRSSVFDLTQQIIDDITIAIPDLPETNTDNRFRASKAAAYSILAKIYYYKDDLQKAAEYAALALEDHNNELFDLSGYTSFTNLPAIRKNQQNIYARMADAGKQPTLDLSLINLYDEGDLRARFLLRIPDDHNTIERGDIVMASGFYNYYANYGTTVQEMMLILAESEAVNNKLDQVNEILDALRKKRIDSEHYLRTDYVTKADALAAIADERRKEFAMTGATRWFDLRLANKRGVAKTISRLDVNNNVIKTLEPGSTGYVLVIPARVTFFSDIN